ncbi:hypothetical protein E8E12_004898 [Didymella heteroderae]|uniref:Uncharacterized protein n=1 Tax=Didymella heteroderae TaxID=1769908 RepID=A0A9P5BYG8_9PLEO|nr:hypothetical protein E8E12_004898 [Didymella heteroderae]
MSSSSVARKQPEYQGQTDMFNALSSPYNSRSVQSARFDQNPPMKSIHEAVLQYRLQSAAHFELEVKAEQISKPYGKSTKTAPKDRSLTLSLDVVFRGASIEGFITVPVQCRLQRSGRRSQKRRWSCLAVAHGQTAKPLYRFLDSKFPVIDAPLRHDTLSRWWLANGKSFNWTALPTELKERVIEHCMHQPPTHGIFSERLARFNWRYKNEKGIRKPGPFEIVGQLGDWYPLLYVSHQVRAITLRLCVSGGGDLNHLKGLCIEAGSYKGLVDRLDRLGDYYQMTTPNGVPVSPAEQALSKTYERFPKIYSQLNRFATLRHGIQKISISMDWLSFMHFFDVTLGGFHRYHNSFKRFHKTKVLTYEVFERLPYLNEIVVRLPLRPYGGWRDRAGQCGSQLWHVDTPCPRIMHRVIYERVAQVLAPYNVTVRNLIDYGEMHRYEAARAEAVKALKFTKVELEELYANDDGGIELAGTERSRSDELEKIRQTKAPEEALVGNVQDEFFPPLCHCDEPCVLAQILTGREHHP